MKTNLKKSVEVDESDFKGNRDFVKFNEVGDSFNGFLGEEVEVDIKGDKKKTFVLADEEEGGEFLAPTNVNLIVKLRKLKGIFDESKTPDEDRKIKITFSGNEKFEGSKFASKVFKVQY